ncbi:hypothetical protein DVT68_00265 [Dyella solisilvae]|uniref:TnsA endonuclease N-terminal domain-containing protein n=1 Tax=Dyella solisilvae TaxID=1920168 RepID=A0A370K9K3_9GAMM|nr:hypothetical protein [Dyella solisilvae]RDI99336.1 hypothetical protein DVT68_00265 [Dyella solisilvae]
MTTASKISEGTPFDVATRIYDGSPRPVTPRAFGRREFERRDVYGFLSIKEDRAIEVDGLPALCVALSLECDPRINAYVERPRKLLVGARSLELDFWVRYKSGREEFLLVVSEADCVSNPGGTRSPRESRRLAEAASLASINLHSITEYDVRVEGSRLMVHNRLLAFTQVAQTLSNGLAIRIRLLNYFSSVGRARIDQAEEALAPLPPSDLHAVICELVCLGALTFDRAYGLTRHTIIERSVRT